MEMEKSLENTIINVIEESAKHKGLQEKRKCYLNPRPSTTEEKAPKIQHELHSKPEK